MTAALEGAPEEAGEEKVEGALVLPAMLARAAVAAAAALGSPAEMQRAHPAYAWGWAGVRHNQLAQVAHEGTWLHVPEGQMAVAADGPGQGSALAAMQSCLRLHVPMGCTEGTLDADHPAGGQGTGRQGGAVPHAMHGGHEGHVAKCPQYAALGHTLGVADVVDGVGNREGHTACSSHHGRKRRTSCGVGLTHAVDHE